MRRPPSAPAGSRRRTFNTLLEMPLPRSVYVDVAVYLDLSILY